MMNLSVNKKQNGAALIVGIIVLLVMTLLGVSSMSSITTELKIANNAQAHTSAFQVAASAIKAALNVGSGVDTGAGGTQVFTYLATDGRSKGTVTVIYSACQEVPTGYSLTQDMTMKGLIHHFNSVGQFINSNDQVIATSVHANGIQTIRPGCPTGASPQ